MNHLAIKLLVRRILEDAVSRAARNVAGENLGFSLQGLGMLRLYLSPALRLHVWHSAFAFPGASPIHDHPWDFDSHVIAGRIKQRRLYTETGFSGWPDIMPVAGKASWAAADRREYEFSTIQCGPGTCVVTPPRRVTLVEGPEEVFEEGTGYGQAASEIHYSYPDEGTVTLVTRRFSRADVDHANVYWPLGQQFGSAEPRPATDKEVYAMCSFALESHFPMEEARR